MKPKTKREEEISFKSFKVGAIIMCIYIMPMTYSFSWMDGFLGTLSNKIDILVALATYFILCTSVIEVTATGIFKWVCKLFEVEFDYAPKERTSCR